MLNTRIDLMIHNTHHECIFCDVTCQGYPQMNRLIESEGPEKSRRIGSRRRNPLSALQITWDLFIQRL